MMTVSPSRTCSPSPTTIGSASTSVLTMGVGKFTFGWSPMAPSAETRADAGPLDTTGAHVAPKGPPLHAVSVASSTALTVSAGMVRTIPRFGDNTTLMILGRLVGVAAHGARSSGGGLGLAGGLSQALVGSSTLTEGARRPELNV